MQWILVELDDGQQEFFETPYDAFKFAKGAENTRRHSVEYVAIGEFETVFDHVVFSGQELRHLLRSVDNVMAWILAGYPNGNIQSMD